MKLASVWTSIVQVFNVLTFSSPEEISGTPVQTPLVVDDDIALHFEPGPKIPVVQTESGEFFHGDTRLVQEYSSGMVYDPNEFKDVPLRACKEEASYVFKGSPVIITPRNPQEGRPDCRLKCHYPTMKGWEPCYSAQNRSCWLRKNRTNEIIDINTDYEDAAAVPVGKIRRFYLEVSEQPISPDGTTMEHGKIFNRMYPGPWIEACWGDWIAEITVKNNLRWNGTSVHWHGIRQFHSFQHDGVNGITECPIAPGDTFTYRFRALQYGSAWYHSHYSLQYGDGLLGPMTIYGPSTANFDDDLAFRPLLLSDWNHRSVFEDWPLMLQSGAAPEMTNILINGTGQFGFGPSPDKYTLYLNASKAHMLILVNTAVDTTFVFSIDDHELEVIEMDFVPIKPYRTDHIKIGIGQRYHVLVHGLKDPYKKERYGNYWMRVVPARKCSKFAFGPDQQMGIVRYNYAYQNWTGPGRLPDPLSEPPLYDIGCADEPSAKLVPWIPWTVGDPVNIDRKLTWTDIDNNKLPNNTKFVFDVGMVKSGGPNSSFPYNGPYIPDDGAYTRWDMHTAPLRVNFSDPTLLALDRLEELIDQPHLDVVTLPNATDEQWIWMVITAPDKVPQNGGKIFFPAAHPMHLHGHDFALLRQSDKNWYNDSAINHVGERWMFTPDKLNCKNPHLNCTNPPRRDVVLLPATGYIIIAFKADNPGAWIFHCHIAFHASHGLAMQIIENKEEMKEIMELDKKDIEESCKRWRDWHGNSMNHWDWHHPSHFQDDSGV
ncbi:multicopper oxidase [Parathielavia appendiculata]|uniref:Multicopper oxidase n=1 Tax=Parathielavia appendiculata TaxID=2587402 RepID=A0AAN6YXQ9_9PEZI|nr:multicopper oxidase [Parathielavia appendiculata]